MSIAPDEALRDRITGYCNDHGVPTEPLDYRVARSEAELPADRRRKAERFDIAFIDGDHGWPTAFVDFCYLNMVTREDGLIFLDDIPAVLRGRALSAARAAAGLRAGRRHLRQGPDLAQGHRPALPPRPRRAAVHHGALG